MASAPVPDTIEGLRRQNAAYRTLLRAMEEELRVHREKAAKYYEATTSLESERAANALLTEEVERLSALASTPN